MPTSEYSFNGADFYTKIANPPDGVATIAKLLFNHGFAEHVERYEDFFRTVNAAGIATFAFDQRGAGRTSPNKKDWGHTDSVALFADLDYFVEKVVKDDADGVPWFMIGFSMGGGITLDYAVHGTYRDLFAGYIGVSPLITLHPRTNPPALIYYALLGVSKLLPNFQYFTGLDFEFLTRDPLQLAIAKDDPLLHATCTLRQMSQMLDRGAKLLQPHYIAGIVQRPVLVIHGTGDKINLYDASKRFIDIVPVPDKTLITIDGAYHELHHDIDDTRTQLYTGLLAWITQHTHAKL
ncbi:Alpha/Beta hydrolase protein [Limtongia smithiae]|uniref:Alpha/Beta hydrolase protein n=1 Tax=Limtongia smithiae TaxID=1125753 RepID=UPI0034CD7831